MQLMVEPVVANGLVFGANVTKPDVDIGLHHSAGSNMVRPCTTTESLRPETLPWWGT